ncbi:MAG: hypothetical protein KAV87_12510 [Desulfobacteraceae bacterium]|nr:hypothetical protein [Desulfobacteraceae bacterium]
MTLGFDHALSKELYWAAAETDLVIVAKSVSSVKLKDKLKPVEPPLIIYEAFIQDEMGLTAKGPAGDPGEPADFAYGVRDKETRINIVDPAHPLAEGATGNLTVYRESKQITWGKVADSAEVIATLPGEKAGAAIYFYRKGAELFNGTTTAGLRVGFFLEDDDETDTANLMTDDGLRLFYAAVKFALGTDAAY